MSMEIWDPSFSTYAKFSEKQRTCAYQGIKNFSFSENFGSVQNEGSLWVVGTPNQIVTRGYTQMKFSKEIK